MKLRRLCAFLLLTSALAFAAQPVVRKVEPPNWWIGLRDPMLLISGENMSNASVRVNYPGVRVLRSEPAANGRYMFVWLKILPTTRPGSVGIDITSSDGNTRAQLPLAARRPPATPGVFQGLSTDDVIYLIMPDRFADGEPANNQPQQSPGTYDRSKPRAYHGGDLPGIRDRLPYLRDLGVTALWLNPVYNNHDLSANDYHGYGAVDFYAVEEHFGTLAEFEALVKAAHEHGIKTFLDNVPNHTGPRHPWTEFPPQPDWFHGTVEQHMAARSPFDPITDPHSVPRQWRDMVEGWFANILPDLNQENPRVAEYLLLNSLWWVEQSGLDGFRLDTFPYVGRRFWSDFHRGLFSAYPRLSTFGEVFHGDVTVTSYFAGGQKRADGIDSGVTTLFDFPLYYAIRKVVIQGAPATEFTNVLQRDWLYSRPDLLVTFIGNHDVKRFSSVPGSTPEKLRLAFSVLLTMRGVPQLYAGDEIGMPGEDDPDNRRDFPGGFPGDPRNAFTAEGRAPEEQQTFSHLQSLLRLRREHAALRNGQQRHLFVDDTAYVFLRESKDETLLIAFNNSEMPRRLTVELADTPIQNAQGLDPLFSARSAVIESGRAQIEIPGRTLAIYGVR